DEIVGKINALDKDMYTADTLAALDSAAKTAMDMYNAKSDYDVNNQAEIDKAAADATAAYDKLALKDADYTAVNEAKDAVAELKKSYYTADSWKAVEDAVAAVETGKKIDEQDAVDAMAKAINDAVAALVMKDADYSTVDGKINQANKLSAKNYTTDSWNALQDAINAVERGLKADKQADVDAMAVAIEKAINGLVSAAAADYTEVNALVDEYNNDVDPALYTEDSYAAYTAAVKAVDYNLNANEQAKVDDMAKAIKDAKEALVLKDADYTAVNEAKDAFAEVDTAKYTEESVKAVEDAIAAVVDGKKIDEQDAVDAMAKAINDAINALELKGADYTAVNDAIAKFEAMDKTPYTSSSVKAVEKAIAAVVEGKTIDEQADVDAMAKAIEDAIDALQIPEGIVTDVVVGQSATNDKDFTVTVKGRPWKVRLINEEGNTITIDRRDNMDNITSYDADGNEVGYLSKVTASEVWNFSLTLKPGTYTVIGKDIVDDWESEDLGYTITIVNSKEDIDIVSVEAESETAKVGEQLPIKVVTGQDIVKLQVLVDDATTGTATFDASAYSTLDGSQRTFDIFVKIYRKGDHTLKIRYKTADGWEVCEDYVLNVTANA
ncbi:MAG: hypothetical protein MJ120_03550, partial [Clostridia bacterium]|nr:hypothetical protein [Clostridia bacterium]